MTPLDYYREQCSNGFILEDQQQLLALKYLQNIYKNVLQEHRNRSGFLAWLRNPQLVQGLYLWGGVGIGKTFLMDCFYHCVPFPEKLRMHFHQFMQLVHHKLKLHQGEKNPLQMIAKELAQQYQLLCFDEFVVNDIADAMILARLFQALFEQRVCLITTSNVMPDDLYKNGLQRKLFLPAVALLKQHTTVFNLPSLMDYRLRYLKKAGVFYAADDALTRENMENIFTLMANGKPANTDAIEICGRSIQIKKQAGDIVWFDFNVICAVPRSQHDYLAIAKEYKTVFISDIPVIPSHDKDTISLFIRLIDIFYDSRIRLILSATEQVEKIYSHGPMLFEYMRTCSRLLEMQSESYFLNVSV